MSTWSRRTATTSTPRSGVRAMGRPRGHQRLVARPGPLRDYGRHQRVAARRARPPRVLRIHADAADAGRDRTHLPENRRTARCSTCSCSTCAATAGRTARRDATIGPDAACSAPRRCAWLKRELTHSQATWKVIAADLPLGVVSADAIAQGDGPPLGRELEIADLLAFIKHAGIRNTVWITADMHYTAAHYYDPNRAVFQDFEPFWEFVSGPLHAGTWGPGELDNTFGPQRGVPEGLQRRARRESRAVLRPAVLRPCRDRRRDRGDDGDAEGRRRPRSVVDADRAEAAALDPRAARTRLASEPCAA